MISLNKIKPIKFVIIFVIFLGVFFRLVNLENKIFTVDEVRGVLRLSGFSDTVFIAEFYDEQPNQAAEILKYQRLNSNRNLSDAMEALARNPEHPPLYYLLSRYWMYLFNYPAAPRFLAVIFGLLLLPAVYWLCQELFNSPMVGWISILLISASPIQLLLSQEARQYSLWLLAVTLSSASLLRALRLQKKSAWALYGLTSIIGLYSHLFTVYALLAQGVYVFIISRFKLSKNIVLYSITATLSCLAFLPWVWLIVTEISRFQETTRWASSHMVSLTNRIEQWLHNLSLAFIDFNIQPDFKNPLVYLALLLTLYSLYFLYRKTQPRVWLHIILMMGITAAAQILPDVLGDGGRRSLLPRYSFPIYLYLQISVAFLLTQRCFPNSILPAINGFKVRKMRLILWRTVLVAILAVGLISCGLITQSLTWGKGSAELNVQVADEINQADAAWIASDAPYMYVLSLAHMLDPDTTFQLFNPSNLDTLNSSSCLLPQVAQYDVFVYLPSDTLKSALEIGCQQPLELILDESEQWLGKPRLYRLST